MPARVIRASARAAAVIGVVAIAMIWPGLNLADAHAYWAAPLNDLYGAARAGGVDAYLYAPAFAQALAPLKALDWPVFAGIWLLLSSVCLVAIVGVWALLVVFIPPVLIELHAGNIHLPLALAIGLGLALPIDLGVRAADQADAWASACCGSSCVGSGASWRSRWARPWRSSRCPS